MSPLLKSDWFFSCAVATIPKQLHRDVDAVLFSIITQLGQRFCPKKAVSKTACQNFLTFYCRWTLDRLSAQASRGTAVARALDALSHVALRFLSLHRPNRYAMLFPATVLLHVPVKLSSDTCRSHLGLCL